MKCAACGREFGNGVNCQSCGVDRITGLANYSGYGNHSRSSNHHHTDNAEQTTNNITACYACGEIIPSDAEYCPYCRKKLYENCPKCGKTYSSQFDNCPKCGTNRVQYNKKLKAEEEEAIRRERVEAIRQEKEQQFRYDAGDIKEKISPYWAYFVFPSIFMAWWFVYLYSDRPDLELIILSIFIGLPISILISNFLYNSIEKSRIEKWKSEHPNDPRSKYL